ncbi:hypothetical protein [Algicola sagamiensis]|uniref:hypothetical protein n=1 Tax=Algicola sagamiensis TaxID=163869 RepID=UPI0003702CD9|nr:hypothetical protein [Algicola sagamiensis]
MEQQQQHQQQQQQLKTPTNQLSFRYGEGFEKKHVLEPESNKIEDYVKNTGAEVKSLETTRCLMTKDGALQ